MDSQNCFSGWAWENVDLSGLNEIAAPPSVSLREKKQTTELQDKEKHAAETRLNVTWLLHSWDHLSYGGFHKSYTNGTYQDFIAGWGGAHEARLLTEGQLRGNDYRVKRHPFFQGYIHW